MMQAGTPRSFNPRTPCGVRPVSATTKELNQIVSIHALLAECDSGSIVAVRCIPGFNPRTPCGVRQGRAARRVNRNVFQSTHSLRSATCQSAACPPPLPVSIHALLAECDPGVRPVKIRICSFNPRTPCGVRPYQFTGFTPTNKFQSTHSLRSATNQICCLPEVLLVSIHALLAECDQRIQPEQRCTACFNPRTPCGVRPKNSVLPDTPRSFNPRTPCGVRRHFTVFRMILLRFQSTHSLRSATPLLRPSHHQGGVSIHALLAECDGAGRDFRGLVLVSIHALLAECDRIQRSVQQIFVVSIHALLAECDCARPYTLLLNRANHTLRQPP